MGQVRSSMAGTVWKVLVQPGMAVAPGMDVVILESMKMEIPISAESAGVVKEIKIKEGDFVNDGDLLLVIE